MTKISKKRKEAFKLVDKSKVVSLEEAAGLVKKITYTHSSNSIPVIIFTYTPSLEHVVVSARANPVTISMQEFLMMVNMLSQYTNQVSLN